MELCYYCKKEPSEGLSPHPQFRTPLPTCSRCYRRLNLYYPQRAFFTRLGCFGPIVTSLLGFVLIKQGTWSLAALAFALTVVVAVGSHLRVRYYAAKVDRATGDYVDVNALRWCKTCAHFRRLKEYEDVIEGTWTQSVVSDATRLPCTNIAETGRVWRDFFETPRDHRTLYPKDCHAWKSRK